MIETKYRIIAVLDTIEDKLISQSLELIAFIEKFNSGDISHTLFVVPGMNVIELCESISKSYGIDTTAIENEKLYYPNPELLAHILPGIIDITRTQMLIFTHTMRNCQCVAKISSTLKVSSVIAVESFKVDSDGCVFLRSIFNGKLKQYVRPKTPGTIITIQPGAYTLPENKDKVKSSGSVIYTGLSEDSKRVKGERGQGSELASYKPLFIFSETDSGLKLEDADVIISAGRGIDREENLNLIRETAEIFANPAIGGSRPVCDQRWLPFNQQVGITGKTVSPKLYVACGISGSQQHIAGMKNSQCIVAINKDPNAAIFSISDYIIVEDLMSFLPVLVKKYRDRYAK